MIIYRLKSENIVFDLYLPEMSNGKVILYVPGLPGHPRKRDIGERFAKEGFSFFEMRFAGSWESDGVFTMDNCVASLHEAYSFVQKGTGTELRRCVEKTWAHDEIILFGSSFGGGVILSSDIEDPLTCVLLAPVTKIKNIKDSVVLLPSGKDDLFSLLSNGYAHVYRGLTELDWDNFLNGKTSINPENNFVNLKNKKLLFVQGSSDTTILSGDTEAFVEELQGQGVNAHIVTVHDAGHGSDLEDKSIELLKGML
jgi:fermentation-respiration switch protein FrsA (DUF1100 family)